MKMLATIGIVIAVILLLTVIFLMYCVVIASGRASRAEEAYWEEEYGRK